jgi:hypothetical protein
MFASFSKAAAEVVRQEHCDQIRDPGEARPQQNWIVPGRCASCVHGLSLPTDVVVDFRPHAEGLPRSFAIGRFVAPNTDAEFTGTERSVLTLPRFLLGSAPRVAGRRRGAVTQETFFCILDAVRLPLL